PASNTTFNFSEKDDELTIVKDKSDIDYLYGISIKDKRTNKVIFESTAWTYGGYGEIIDGVETLQPYVKIAKNVFKKSGDYEISIEPLIKWDNCLDCDFSAEYIEKFISRYTLSITLDEQSYSKAELGKYIGISCAVLGVLAGLIMVYIKQRNRKLLAEKETEKNTAKLQLNSIRSQLNPHFLFNSLSGIQNLMNKKEIENANKYLTKFARLTRNVLDDKELISLSQEKTLLDDYLQMEQLRYGFNYDIIHADKVALENIEVPSMLLQPFVENAVKHGISQKSSQGKIIISFFEEGNNLILTVSDNGNGFDAEKKSAGLGLLLSANRIALLNRIYKENHFNLAISSTNDGTEISLTLTDWL
ncbi:MAG: sensor histidine kinase, partial [Sphingobacterium sp.]